MYINIGKNLKLESTNDTKISKFVRDYSDIHDMVEQKYQDTTQPIILKDLLETIVQNFVISWDNLPSGATFVWSYDGQTIPNPYNARSGQTIDYVLTYSDGSKCVGNFIVDGNYTLDLSTLEPNIFILTITANKTLTGARVYHNYIDESTPYTSYTTFTNNTLSVECNKNEKVRISAVCDGWSEIDKKTDDWNYNYTGHIYTNITQNVSETYQYNYVAYDSIRIFLKDENDNYIDMDDNPYLNYITWTPSDINKFTSVGIIKKYGTLPGDYYNAYKDTSISVDYEINIPNYSKITGTFGTSSQPPTKYHNQTQTIIPMCTYTIIPNPSTATVTMTASGYNTVSGVGPQSITVTKGTNVVWLLECTGYVTKNGSTQVTTTFSDTIPMEQDDTHELDIVDYEYTNIDYHLELNKYIGSNTDVSIPNI